MARSQGLRIKDHKVIAAYAEEKGLIPDISDIPNRIIYFVRRGTREQLKVPLSTIYLEVGKNE